ncbi:SH3 domain protein, partial [Trifolium medium]|nr:SH3 domain protein [Trifolium medium]
FPDLNRVDFRISSADPVAVRNALEIVSEIAARDPYAVAMALGNIQSS